MILQTDSTTFEFHALKVDIKSLKVISQTKRIFSGYEGNYFYVFPSGSDIYFMKYDGPTITFQKCAENGMGECVSVGTPFSKISGKTVRHINQGLKPFASKDSCELTCKKTDTPSFESACSNACSSGISTLKHTFCLKTFDRWTGSKWKYRIYCTVCDHSLNNCTDASNFKLLTQELNTADDFGIEFSDLNTALAVFEKKDITVAF